VIERITEDLEVSIKEKGALFKINALPVVKGIPGQMHQLFQNLISNAIKFNTEVPVIEIGEQELTEEMKKLYDVVSDNYVVIYVQDNGIGFDEQYSEKIFGVFQRLDKTTYQGTGIGLAIAKKIVENHRGFIHADSELGRGARFIVMLPK
jgi:two-component system CheB/CheR fusion protein